MDLVALTARLARAGFDIVQPFPARAVAAIDPVFARLDCADVGILVGNTRGLWPLVLAARAANPAAFDRDPFDRYTEAILGAVEAVHTIYAHEPDPDGRFFPFQRLAVAVGLAALAPSQLLIHPTYGPWFALRAVILAPGTPPPLAPRVALPCACVDRLRTPSESAARPGKAGTCDHGCVAKFDHAMAHPDDWRAWLAVRDACPVGRDHRYGDDQIAYHYTKDRRYLPLVG